MVLIPLPSRSPFAHNSAFVVRCRGVRRISDGAEEQEHYEDLGLAPAQVATAAAQVDAVRKIRPP